MMNIFKTNHEVFMWQIIFFRCIESMIFDILNNVLSLVFLASTSHTSPFPLKQILQKVS